MKKIIITLLVFTNIYANAQEEKENTIQKDTIKTEIVEVITSYTPRVTDAEKIKRNPKIEFSRNTDKKKLKYNFTIKPVASTFVPKGVQMKVIKQEEKERIFNNYIKSGIGNSFTPYIDINIHKNSAYKYDYGVQLKGIYSENPIIKDVRSDYFNSELNLFYKQEGNYFNWLIRSDFSFDGYKWYGIPEKNIRFSEDVLKIIDENSSQHYNKYKLSTEIDFDELYIESVKSNLSFFHDYYYNKEIAFGAGSLFIFPIQKIRGFKPEDLKINTSLNTILGGFKNSYNNINEPEKHKFISFGVNPYYEWIYKRLKSKIGVKTTFASNLVNSKKWYLVNPDLHFNLSLSKNNSHSIYLGAKGGIKQNSYEKLSSENPFMSPTSKILPTNEKYNGYMGFKGIISSKFNYNLTTNYLLEENKGMFVANKSKSKGNESYDLLTNTSYQAYEYGNSYGVTYDDIKTLSFNTELEYVVDGRLNIGVIGKYNLYSSTKLKEVYNLPQLKAELFTKYNSKNWFAGMNVYYIGKRKAKEYSNYDSAKNINLKGYYSLNIDAGYHINEYLSLFAKGSNLTNNSYEVYNNYQAQSLLIIGGVIFKFDRLTKTKGIKKLKRQKSSKFFRRQKLKRFKRATGRKRFRWFK